MTINDLRKKTSDEKLAKKAKNLIKEWKNLVDKREDKKEKVCCSNFCGRRKSWIDFEPPHFTLRFFGTNPERGPSSVFHIRQSVPNKPGYLFLQLCVMYEHPCLSFFFCNFWTNLPICMKRNCRPFLDLHRFRLFAIGQHRLTFLIGFSIFILCIFYLFSKIFHSYVFPLRRQRMSRLRRARLRMGHCQPNRCRNLHSLPASITPPISLQSTWKTTRFSLISNNIFTFTCLFTHAALSAFAQLDLAKPLPLCCLQLWSYGRWGTNAASWSADTQFMWHSCTLSSLRLIGSIWLLVVLELWLQELCA